MLEEFLRTPLLPEPVLAVSRVLGHSELSELIDEVPLLLQQRVAQLLRQEFLRLTLHAPALSRLWWLWWLWWLSLPSLPSLRLLLSWPLPLSLLWLAFQAPRARHRDEALRRRLFDEHGRLGHLQSKKNGS